MPLDAGHQRVSCVWNTQPETRILFPKKKFQDETFDFKVSAGVRCGRFSWIIEWKKFAGGAPNTKHSNRHRS